MRLRDAKGITEGRIDILYCEPGQLKIEDGYNVRDLTTPLAREKLDGLKAEIKEHGVQTPLKVRFDGEHIWIVEGHRRHTVVMELIAEFKTSKGADGRKIEAVPIYAEAKGTTPLDRDFGLKHSNSGEKLEPLEFANLIYRTIHQRGISEQEAAKGFGVSITVLRNHLAMRAMPEPVKEHVRKGEISATLASKISKNADPAMAEKLIEANLEENRRIKGSGKGNARVTPKTMKRDAAKAKPPAQPQDQEPEHAEPQSLPATDAAPHSVPTPSPPVVAAPPQPLPGISEDRVEPDAVDTGSREAVVQLTPQSNGMKAIADALLPLARMAEVTDLDELGDDHVLEISVRDVKRGAAAWRRITGQTSTAGGEEIAA